MGGDAYAFGIHYTIWKNLVYAPYEGGQDGACFKIGGNEFKEGDFTMNCAFSKYILRIESMTNYSMDFTNNYLSKYTSKLHVC